MSTETKQTGMQAKLILACGADYGTGATCIMNYVALELAKKGTVLLIEFKKKTGFTLYMQKGHHERRRSLSEVVNIPERLSENVIRSPHNSNMFYICMNLYEDVLRLQDYQGKKIVNIIAEANKIFDYIILDLPADPMEPAVGVAFGKDLIYKPDHTLIFLDERVSTYKNLNDFNAILAMSGETKPRQTTFIMNKVATAHYQEYVEDYLPSLPLTKPTNKVWLPYLEELIPATNKGNIYETGINNKTKAFFKQIESLADIIINNKEGVNLSKETLNKSMNIQEENSGFFGKLFKKKVKGNITTAEEANIHNETVDNMIETGEIADLNLPEEDIYDMLESDLFKEEDIEDDVGGIFIESQKSELIPDPDLGYSEDMVSEIDEDQDMLDTLLGQ